MNLEKTKWPDGKKCAAMLTINLNAELFWLQIDPSCKDMPKTLSLGQYGMTRGVDRILSILKERGIKATFFTPGWVAEQYPDKLKKIKEEGHEIASLAYKHENMALLTEEEQEEAMKKGRILGSSSITGYKKNDAKLIVVPEEAQKIKKIFELYSTGKYGFSKLASILSLSVTMY